jgi:hypothetical protein
MGGPVFVLLVAAIIFIPEKPAPYRPGTEAATSDEITRRLVRELPADAPKIQFVDAARESGIDFKHFQDERSIQLPEDMGSGAAWGDFDNDGDPDLFLVNESRLAGPGGSPELTSTARAALFLNDGGRFTDVTESAGVPVRGLGMAAAWGDYDGDSNLDLVVTRFGTNVLYHNNGNGTFTDVSQPSRIGSEKGFWTGATWADYDLDGDLDLYICGYVQYRNDEKLARMTSLQYNAVVPFTLNPSTYSPERNLLFRNDGGRFKEVAVEAGVENPTGRSLSATWSDFDQDGRLDLYVANDISDNALYWNKGDGTFEDVSHPSWVADYRGAMGLGVGDWDNDGDQDMFVTHWIAQENALYENLHGTMPAGPGEPVHFVDNADMLGLGQVALDYIGWGTGFIDFDNDGWLDLFVVNGSTFQVTDDPGKLIPMPNQLFWNAGPGRGFFEMGEAGGQSFAVENVGRGAAFADYDLDGDIDALVAVNGGPARLLRNDGGNEKSWARVVIREATPPDARSGRRSGGVVNTFAVGARIRITTGELTQLRELGVNTSYLGQDPPGEAHFGLGEAESIDILEITWPDGSEQTFENLAARKTLTILKGQEPEYGSKVAAE